MKKLLAHLFLFAAALLYGANYSIAKLVLDDGYILPLGFIMLRVLAATLLFWLSERLFIRQSIARSDWPRLILLALFGVALNQMLFFSGLKLTTPIHAALIMTTTPLLILVISFFLREEPITRRKLLGISVGIIGAILLILEKSGAGSGSSSSAFRQMEAVVLGDLMVFINALSYAVYLVLARKLMRKYHPITVVKWAFTLGIFFVLPFGGNQLAAVSWSSFSTTIWLAVAYVLVGTTFLAYLFNALALKMVKPSIVGTYVYLQPLLATLVALAMQADRLTFIKISSGLLIVLGVWMVSSKPKTQP